MQMYYCVLKREQTLGPSDNIFGVINDCDFIYLYVLNVG